MTKSRTLSYLLAALCVAAACARSPLAAAQKAAPAKAELRSCRIGDAEVRCGTYEVFEDRAARKGRKIALNVVVLPATGPKRAPDPVFYLVGGPGQGAASLAPAFGSNFMADIRRERDVVLVDQRGTGGSNRLDCDFCGEDLNCYFAEMFPAEGVRACRERLEKTADLKLYTTPIAVDDLDEVRAALGYEKINLYGGSYGTTVALVYLRRYPARVRSVVLQGAAPTDFKLPLAYPKAADLALDRLFADCAADAGCAKAFPNLRAELSAILARFDAGPVEFEMKSPFTGKAERVRMARGVFAEHIRRMMYAAEIMRILPAVIHRAYEKDYVPFATVALMLEREVGKQLANGMYLSVTCAEGAPFITEREIASEATGTFLGEYRVRAHMKACEQWPRGDAGAGFTDPVVSDVPVLVVSGELDPATPSWRGADIVKRLANGRQVVVPNASHATGSSCVAGLIAAFVSKGSAKDLDASCVEANRRPPFETSIPADFFEP